MKIDMVRSFAALLGLSIAVPAYAQYGQSSGQYVAPNKWSNFNAATAQWQAPPQTAASNVGAAPANASAASPPAYTLARPAAPYPQYPSAQNDNAVEARPLFRSMPAAFRMAAQDVLDSNATGNADDYSLLTPEPVPAPKAEPAPRPVPAKAQPNYTPPYAVYDQHAQAPPMANGGLITHEGYSTVAPSPYSQALSAPWTDCDPAPQMQACAPAAPTRLPLSPWFAGGDVLLWNVANNGYRRFLLQDGMPSTTFLSSSDIDPRSAAGYDVFLGRYFGCGAYGVSVNYLNFDPASREAMVSSAVAGGYYASLPAWRDISIDRDGAGPGAADTIYNIYDNATSYRITRDVDVQGLELNLSAFGMTGARRVGPFCGGPAGCGPLASLRNALCCNSCSGYTNSCGPLVNPCTGCAQFVTSSGFRWFQFRDQFQFAASDSATGINGTNDMYYNSNVSNNLYGYQLGSRLCYCLSPCLVARVGGKAGLYANDVRVRQQLGTSTANAWVTNRPTQMINTSDSDTVLAGLGELDLGLGYRVNNGFTINGGYRMLYASGVATSIGSIPGEYFTNSASGKVNASDSLLLHGAYIGGMFNW